MEKPTISVIEFDEPKTWVLGEREIKIKKLETSTHRWTLDVPENEELETIPPFKVAYNIIKNTALLSNGIFYEVSPKQVMARLQDLTGSTLIRTQWILPIEVFNGVVYDLMFSENIDENKFHIISNMSGKE